MKKSAFTLIEILVVIVIIGILATIGTAQFNEYQEKARYARALAFHRQVISKMDTFFEEKIGYWPMEVNENPRPDFSGNNNHLIQLQDTLETIDCFHTSSQGCQKITGNGSYNNYDLNPSQQMTMPSKNTDNPNEFTLSFWMKTQNQNGAGPHFTNGTTNISPGLLNFYPRITFGTTTVDVSKKAVVDKWFHFLVSYDGIKLRVYIDGVQYHNEPVNTAEKNSDFSLISSIKSGYVTSGSEVWVDDIHLWGHALDL
jgi:prepilin-type N-terminal cleavage/methylation domain-containing protein